MNSEIKKADAKIEFVAAQGGIRVFCVLISIDPTSIEQLHVAYLEGRVGKGSGGGGEGCESEGFNRRLSFSWR